LHNAFISENKSKTAEVQFLWNCTKL